jgi:hypothetical protein
VVVAVKSSHHDSVLETKDLGKFLATTSGRVGLVFRAAPIQSALLAGLPVPGIAQCRFRRVAGTLQGTLRVRATKGFVGFRKWMERYFVLDTTAGLFRRFHSAEQFVSDPMGGRAVLLRDIASVRLVAASDGETGAFSEFDLVCAPSSVAAPSTVLNLKAANWYECQVWAASLAMATGQASASHADGRLASSSGPVLLAASWSSSREEEEAEKPAIPPEASTMVAQSVTPAVASTVMAEDIPPASTTTMATTTMVPQDSRTPMVEEVRATMAETPPESSTAVLEAVVPRVDLVSEAIAPAGPKTRRDKTAWGIQTVSGSDIKPESPNPTTTTTTTAAAAAAAEEEEEEEEEEESNGLRPRRSGTMLKYVLPADNGSESSGGPDISVAVRFMQVPVRLRKVDEASQWALTSQSGVLGSVSAAHLPLMMRWIRGCFSPMGDDVDAPAGLYGPWGTDIAAMASTVAVSLALMPVPAPAAETVRGALVTSVSPVASPEGSHSAGVLAPGEKSGVVRSLDAAILAASASVEQYPHAQPQGALSEVRRLAPWLDEADTWLVAQVALDRTQPIGTTPLRSFHYEPSISHSINVRIHRQRLLGQGDDPDTLFRRAWPGDSVFWPGDLVLSINDVSTSEMSVSDALKQVHEILLASPDADIVARVARPIRVFAQALPDDSKAPPPSTEPVKTVSTPRTAGSTQSTPNDAGRGRKRQVDPEEAVKQKLASDRLSSGLPSMSTPIRLNYRGADQSLQDISSPEISPDIRVRPPLGGSKEEALMLSWTTGHISLPDGGSSKKRFRKWWKRRQQSGTKGRRSRSASPQPTSRELTSTEASRPKFGGGDYRPGESIFDALEPSAKMRTSMGTHPSPVASTANPMLRRAQSDHSSQASDKRGALGSSPLAVGQSPRPQPRRASQFVGYSPLWAERARDKTTAAQASLERLAQVANVPVETVRLAQVVRSPTIALFKGSWPSKASVLSPERALEALQGLCALS